MGDDCLAHKVKEAAHLRHVLAVNLRFIRKNNRYTREDVYGLTDISVNEIGKLEREVTSAGLDTLAALAKGLGMEAAQLLDPHLDPTAVLLYPDENVMEQIRAELVGLLPDEQKHIAVLVHIQAAHCHDSRSVSEKLRIE